MSEDLRPKAIIVDLDGTSADNAYRVKYVDGSQKKDWKKFNELCGQDPVVVWCQDLVRGLYRQGYAVLFLTARSADPSTELLTKTWLVQHFSDVEYSLFMRKDKDFRPDFVTKEEIYLTQIAPFYKVAFAIDDKGAVCNMWRGLGLVALHCADY